MERTNIFAAIVIMLFVVVTLFFVIITPIIPVTKTVSVPVVETVVRTKTLYEGRDLYISFMGYRYSGPYYLKAGETVTVTWDADSLVNVYILNDVDWSKRLFFAPTSYRAFRSATSGALSYTLKYDEPIYIVVLHPALASAKLYYWKETLSWTEAVTTYKNREVTEYKSILELLYERLSGR